MSRLPRTALVALACTALAGCMTGQRPTLQPAEVGGLPGTSTGDANIDAVLQKLERGDSVVFTANYDVTQLVQQRVTEAVVSADSSRLSITLGRIRFLSVGKQQTCDLDAGSCEDGWLDARVSDTGVNHAFYQDQPARRLRIAAARKTGPTTQTTETIAGYPAACVSVPLGAGAETYCANDLDVIARWDAADVKVELTALSPSPSEEQFSTTG